MHRSIRGDDATVFEPQLNAKVDELFLRWISMPQQSYLFEQLQKVPYNTSSSRRVEAKLDNHTSPESINDNTKPILSPRRVTKSVRPSSTPSSLADTKHPEKLKPVLKQSTSVKTSPPVRTTATLKIHPSASKIPRFYFPNGKPDKTASQGLDKKISDAFSSTTEKRLKLSQMAAVCEACGCPLYWKSCLFKKSAKNDSVTVTKEEVIAVWKNLVSNYHDDASRFVNLLCKDGHNFLEFDDFALLMRDVVDTHPGLSFLKEAPEFHTRYMNTVIARIFYTVNRSWSRKITVNELRRSNFLSVLKSLEDEQDINSVTEYFSYEHFYVIYCKFWELDSDHDLVIDNNDLARHGDGVLSSRLISRLTSGALQRFEDQSQKQGTMLYMDFVWFLISEEDKTTKTSIEYWFRCMDLDGDGYISLYEMEYFYEEQIRKLELLDIEPLPFIDCACSILDMIRPSKPDCVSLGDLKRCGMAGIFFDTFLNVEKYLEHEQKDPFANTILDGEDGNDIKQTDWEKYASEEYELLVAEEQANEADALANLLDEISHNQQTKGFNYGSNETSW